MTATTVAAHTDEDLRRIYDSAHGEGSWGTDWEAEPAQAGGEFQPSGPPALDVKTFSDFLGADFGSKEWRVDGLLPGSGVGLILGASKAGKSLLATQACLSIAGGVDFLGRRVRQCPTLLVEEEGALQSLQDRLAAQAANLGVLWMPDLPFHVVARQQVRIDNPASLAQLRQVIHDRAIEFVVIGPLSQSAGVQDENKAPELNNVMRNLNQLATDLNVLVMLMHHRRKDDVKSGPPKSVGAFFDSSRGSNAIVGAIDVGLGLSREQEDDDGWLYVMSRDVQSSKEHYTFDRRTLCVHPSDAPVREQRNSPSIVLRLLQEHGVLGAQQIADLIGMERKAAQTRIDKLIADGSVRQRREGLRVLFEAVSAAAPDIIQDGQKATAR